MSAATSREQVNRSRQERKLTGWCCVVGVFRLVSGWVWVLLRWSLRLYCFGSAAVVPTCRFPVRSVLGWWFWRGLFCCLGWLRFLVGVPRCAMLRSNRWVSAPHGRRCVSVVLTWRKRVKQAKVFSAPVRFSSRCCPFGASSLIVK